MGFRYEFTIVILFLVGGFLLVERTDISAVLTGWLKSGLNFIINGITGGSRSAYDYFSSFETSDLVGILLILVAIHLLILRGRKKLTVQYGNIHACPYCNHEKMKRVKRFYWHKLLGYSLMLRTKHYRCLSCNKSTITFSQMKP